MMTLTEIMTEHPFTLGPQNSVKQAMELMQQEQIRHIPIVDEHLHLSAHLEIINRGSPYDDICMQYFLHDSVYIVINHTLAQFLES